MLYEDKNELIAVIVIMLPFFLFVKFITVMIIIGLIHRVVFFSMLAATCGLIILVLSFRTVGSGFSMNCLLFRL